MDTSTPVKKQKSECLYGGLRRKAIENDCERNLHVSTHKSPVEDTELIYSQSSGDIQLNRSEELFPFSPIPFRKEVPSTLLPFLDTPDTKWTSSLFTSFHAHSQNASPEVLSEDNFVRTICIDSHIENNARYTTNSDFKSEIRDISTDSKIKNKPLPDTYVEKTTSCPSPPIIVTKRKEKKCSSVNKELFPFPSTSDRVSREQSPSLDCGAMSDTTLNALEQICIDSEIMYSKNSSRKSNIENTSLAGEVESDFVQHSIDIQQKNRPKFVYPYENVKKPDSPVLINDILQTALSLEANEMSTRISVRGENFPKGLVSFSTLESSMSQAENQTCSLPSTVRHEAKIENCHGITATDPTVQIIYLPIFFCSRAQMSSDDRDILTVLKRYFEYYRVRFAQLISDHHREALCDALSLFINCSRSKFPKLNFYSAIVDSFFEFFTLNPDLIYNFSVSRRFFVICSPTSLVTYVKYKRGTQYSSRNSELSDNLVQSLPSVASCLPKTTQSSIKLKNKAVNITGNKEITAVDKIPSCQKVVPSSTASTEKLPVTDERLFFNVHKTSNQIQVRCDKSELKTVDMQIDEVHGDRVSGQQSFYHSDLSSPRKLMLELAAAFNMASEKCKRVDRDLILRAKKLLEDITAVQINAPDEKCEKYELMQCPAKKTSINVDVKSNSAAFISKTPFDDDLDSTDLLFICDLSEKTDLRDSSNFLASDQLSNKNSKITESSKDLLTTNSKSTESECRVLAETKVTTGTPLICNATKNLNSMVTSTECPAGTHSSPNHASKSMSLRASMKKCVSESSREKLFNTSQKSVLHAQRKLLDDIENWNPQHTVTFEEIKNQTSDNPSNTKETDTRSSDLVGVSAFAGKFAFDGFNTATGRKISVQPKSLVRAKKLLDTVQIEPELTEELFLDQKRMPSICIPDKSYKISREKNTLVDDKIVDPAEKSVFPELKNVEYYPKPCSTFSTASGKMMTVSEKYLKKAKEMYESTAEENFVDKIKKKENVSSSGRLPVGTANVSGKTKVAENSISNREPYKSNTFKKPSVSTTISKKSEPESYHQLGGFHSAAGKKLTVNENSLKRAEKLYASITDDAFFENAQNSKLASFNSASGKNILVADTSLEKAKKLYESTAEETTFCKSSSVGGNAGRQKPLLTAAADLEYSYPEVRQQFTGFNTASGKKMNVNEESLKKAEELYDSVSKETPITSGQNLPEQRASSTSGKKFITEKSVQTVQKLYNKDKHAINKFEKSLTESSSGAKFPTFCSAAGKEINMNEKNLLNAQKIFQSVSDEVVIDSGNIENFESDFLPQNANGGEMLSYSHPNGVTAELVSSYQCLKRSLNEDTLQNSPCSSSKAVKKMKTNEYASELLEKSDGIISESKSCEKTLKILSSNCEADFMLGMVTAMKTVINEDENPTAIVSEQSDDPSKLLVESSFTCSGENCVQISLENSLVDTVLNTTNAILSNSDSKEIEELSAKQSGTCIKTKSTKRRISVDDPTLLNLSQEISESTSAFLFDMKTDDHAFAPVHSPSYLDCVDEQESKTATTTTSRSSSPVFDSCKSGRKKQYKKRRSQHSLSLNPLEVTYVRKECENASVRESSAEEVLKMLNQNFAQKVNKRKEPASNLVYPSSKKAKDTIENDEYLEQRKQMILEQEILVNRKDEQLCKPRVGSIFAEKMRGNRKSLREMVNYERPQRYSVSKLLQFGLKRSVVNVSADNAQEFTFTADFLSAESVTYGDECLVIPDEKHEVYFENLARAFLASPGVDPRLISLPWIRNHFRWIIWKLASTEKSFPRVFGGRYLTLNNVLLQLKFRYDWEVDHCHRSALKRILECDNSPSETMILCVANVKTTASNEYEMEMTDGWYSVPCLFDGEMLKLLTQRKVTVGTKLMIMNAELTGVGEGCDPLQLGPNVRLKIATNSVRRARWYAPLGFYAVNPIIISDLRAILPKGGIVPQFTAVIARVYPMLYLEKKDDGSYVLHNEKVHFKKIADFERRRQVCLENLVSQVTSEIEKENSSMESDDYQNAEVYSNPIDHQNHRYREQERLQILIQERVKQKLPEEFKTPKRVSSMLKVRLINKDARNDPLPCALLTIWHPPEDLVSLLSEGKLYEFHKILADGYRNGQIQLSAKRMTKYKHLSVCDPFCHGRRVTKFAELNAEFKTVFDEVDIVGLVVNVNEATSDTKNDSWQTIYLADLEKNLIILKFRTNVKELGFEDTLKLKNVIAGLNVQWKRGLHNGQIPILFASELTSFVHKSRCEYLQNCIDKFNDIFKNKSMDEFITECNEKLNDILAISGPMATSTPERSSKRPLLAKENCITLEPTCNSSSKQNNSTDTLNSSGNAKSKCVQSRMEKLRGYGEPPSLSPISMCARPRNSRLSIQTRVHKLSISKN